VLNAVVSFFINSLPYRFILKFILRIFWNLPALLTSTLTLFSCLPHILLGYCSSSWLMMCWLVLFSCNTHLITLPCCAVCRDMFCFACALKSLVTHYRSLTERKLCLHSRTQFPECLSVDDPRWGLTRGRVGRRAAWALVPHDVWWCRTVNSIRTLSSIRSLEL